MTLSPELVRSEDRLPSLLSSLHIRGLHGIYDYDLSLETLEGVGRLALLYGDNGCGKTTILRLLWDLLSPSPNSHHRNRLAKVAFSEFTVRLTGQRSISVRRAVPAAGPYTIELIRPQQKTSVSSWPETGTYDDYFSGLSESQILTRSNEMTFDKEIVEAAKRVLAKKGYLSFLESLGSGPFFLADDRSTASDEFKDDTERERRIRQQMHSGRDDQAQGEAKRLAQELATSMKRVNVVLQQVALGGTASGSASANSVYLDILKQMGASGQVLKDDHEVRRESIALAVGELGKRSVAFEALGLIPRFVSSDFAKAVRQLDDTKIVIADAILTPYLDSLAARLDALQEAQHLISTFLGETNSFLRGKKLTYSARSGLSIVLDSGEHLVPSQLSSGECHIILLLSNALLARDGSKLFLIDEPELSLNVKWQRRVLKSLLACTAGSNVQFVIATHSIELLSAYRANVVKMRAHENADV